MWSMLLCIMHLCLPVTAIIDAYDKYALFTLQPNHISKIVKIQPSYVQDMFVNDAAVNLLSCLQVTATIDAPAKMQPRLTIR